MVIVPNDVCPGVDLVFVHVSTVLHSGLSVQYVQSGGERISYRFYTKRRRRDSILTESVQVV